MRRFCLLVLVTTLPAFGQELAQTLMPSTEPIVAGQVMLVDFVALNPGGLEAPFVAPASLEGKITSGSTEQPVTLTAIAVAPKAVGPGTFALRRYKITVPAGLSGRGVLEVTTPNGAVLRAVVDIQPAAIASAAPVEPAPTPLGKSAMSTPVSSMIARTFAGRFMANQPIYFLYGSNTEQAVKFQFSFDYRLAAFRWGKPYDEKLTSLRFGYTQRSLWNIKDASSPFYDTSYMPEFALNTDSTLPKESSWFTWMGARIAFQHESNGRAGTDSRSMNTVYLRPRFVLGSFDSWVVVVLPEIQAYVGDVSDNPAIKDYRGYGKLRLYVGHSDGPALMFSGWTGRDFDHGTYQLDLTWPLRVHWLNIEAYLQAQYFNGYGESLRAYDQKSEALRFGFGLVR